MSEENLDSVNQSGSNITTTGPLTVMTSPDCTMAAMSRHPLFEERVLQRIGPALVLRQNLVHFGDGQFLAPLGGLYRRHLNPAADLAVLTGSLGNNVSAQRLQLLDLRVRLVQAVEQVQGVLRHPSQREPVIVEHRR